MEEKSVVPPILRLSFSLYEALLVAYPARFRQEYGMHMQQLFRDCCLRTFRQAGTVGMLGLWVTTLFDFFSSMFEQHLEKEAHVSSSQFIRLSGWAFMVGSFAFAMIFLADSFVATLVSSALFAIGTLGLRVRYGERGGRFGSSVLLTGVIAMVALYVVLGLLYVLHTYFGMIQLRTTENFNPTSLWVALFAGPAIVLIALTLFGLAAVLGRPMARLNWLPVVAGIGYPLIYTYFSAYVLTHYGRYPAGYQSAINAAMMIQAFALLLLGGILVADTPPEIATA